MESNQIWYNRAWVYSDKYLGDYNFKLEFNFIRKEVGKPVKIKPYIPKNKDKEGNTDNI